MAEVQSEPISRLIAPASETSTPASIPSFRPGLEAANLAPRCSAHATRTGKPCKMAAIRGMSVCKMHGGRAPQVRAAAALRLAMAADPAVRELVTILKNRKHPHQLQAIKEVLERNGLDAFGRPLESQLSIYQPPASTVNVNVTNVHLDQMSDEELSLAERVFRGVIEAEQK